MHLEPSNLKGSRVVTLRHLCKRDFRRRAQARRLLERVKRAESALERIRSCCDHPQREHVIKQNSRIQTRVITCNICTELIDVQRAPALMPG